MARTTPNLLLRVWDLLSDKFSHTELTANWDALDAHDHTSGKGLQIPTGGLVPGAITLSVMADSLKPSTGASDATEALRSIGPGAGQVVAGSDVRLSDQRVPTDSSVGWEKTGLSATGLADQSFSAWSGRAGGQTFPNGVFQIVEFQQTLWDHGDAFATDLYRFRPSRAGIYRLSGAVTWFSAISDGVAMILTVFKNGAEYRVLDSSRASLATNDWTLSGSVLVEMNGTTDYCDLRAYHGDSGARDLRHTAAHTYFQGEMVGRV